MGICKTHSVFPSCHSFYSWLFFSCRYRSITFFFSLFLFFRFFSRFEILMTGREVCYVMMSNVYRRSNTFLSVCLSAFLLCFGSHCTISIVRVRMTLTGGRRFFLLRFFFLRQSSPFLYFFSSLALPLVLLQ